MTYTTRHLVRTLAIVLSAMAVSLLLQLTVFSDNATARWWTVGAQILAQGAAICWQLVSDKRAFTRKYGL